VYEYGRGLVGPFFVDLPFIIDSFDQVAKKTGYSCLIA